jgi:hypothetical protein
MKKVFTKLYPEEMNDQFLVDIESFARELLVDASEFDSPNYILPQLTRDSFSKKGLFSTIEKIIIQTSR